MYDHANNVGTVPSTYDKVILPLTFSNVVCFQSITISFKDLTQEKNRIKIKLAILIEVFARTMLKDLFTSSAIVIRFVVVRNFIQFLT